MWLWILTAQRRRQNWKMPQNIVIPLPRAIAVLGRPSIVNVDRVPVACALY